jgi:hypothetical protein
VEALGLYFELNVKSQGLKPSLPDLSLKTSIERAPNKKKVNQKKMVNSSAQLLIAPVEYAKRAF